jgi:hypothetical protein
MAVRRQAFEWRNVMPIGKTVNLNSHPVLVPNNVHTVPLSAGIPYDIFVGNVGNTLDVPGELKAFQYIVLDAVAVSPPTLQAQIYVNTTRYFQNPDRSVSQGISGNIVPFPNGKGGIINYDYQEGLQPALYISPNQVWGVEVTPLEDIPEYTGVDVTDENIAFCFVKYLLIDGVDALVAKALIDAGWELSVQNIQKYKEIVVKNHIHAGTAALPKSISERKRRV